MSRGFIIIAIVACTIGLAFAALTVPTTIDQPGTQPQEINDLESPENCAECHGGYDPAVEPTFNWQGSMMANAGRDPIFWATLAVVEQDVDGAGDLCIRCHSTAGWLAGRSTPTDGSGLAATDEDGVICHFCHSLTNPDNSEHIGAQTGPFIPNDDAEGYYGSGMASLWAGSDVLGPYSDAHWPPHWMASQFHRSVDFCGTCHDVSNPGVGNISHNFGAQDAFLITETVVADGSFNEDPKDYTNKAAFGNPPYKYGIVERTFSEYKAGLISKTLVRDYMNLPSALQAGVLQAAYTAALAAGTGGNYEDGTDRYFSCQTCHMSPLSGKGCVMRMAPFRKDLPWHNMTGGNYWMPDAIVYLDGQDKLRLGGGLTAVQIDALKAGKMRAMQQLDLAATLTVQGNTLSLVNHTGHKLITGYPEGRRMWLNIKWYDGADNLVRVDGDYGPIAVEWDVNGDNIVDENDTVDSIVDLHDPNTKIYEAHYGMTRQWAQQLITLDSANRQVPLSYDRISGEADVLLGDLAGAPPGTAYETFHFVWNNTILKDNRIPPYGMDYETARLRNALPVPHNQYNGGPNKTYDYFDTVQLNPPQAAVRAAIELRYQPTSYEYQLFLLRANRKGNPFLANEGDYMFEAWLQTNMAQPYIMATATWTNSEYPCEGDFDEDGDVDGHDLAIGIDSAGLDIQILSENFGRINCP